ncbi:MAG: amidohydrolase family protein [Oscillospiraceae bacterium]|nr:amidohydrolase family protein [Oscillospiraceae bacterium]
MEIIHANVISNGAMLADAYVRASDGVIREIGAMEQYAPDGSKVLDAEGNVLCAGYIDQHTHGAMGYDVMDATKEALDEICRHHFRNGVTTILPTTMTASLEETTKVLSFLRDYAPPVPVKIPGVHMEGPFFSVKNRGAHIERLLTAPTDAWQQMIREHAEVVKMISLSPELEGMVSFIRLCGELGIVVSGGHDDGYDDPIYAAIEAGMRNVTHIFCCSSGITRRGSPWKRLGLTEIGLTDNRLYADAIADGNGIPYDLLPLLFRAKGRDRLIFISDSMRATGLQPGTYRLGSDEEGVIVDVTETAAILHGENLFAGSIACVSKMVEDAVKRSGIPLVDAVLAATRNPAALLGLEDRGDLLPGMASAMNLITKEGELRKTVVWETVYEKGEEIQ